MKESNYRERKEVQAHISQIKKSISDLEGYAFSDSYGTTDHSIEIIVSAESLLRNTLACLKAVRRFKK